jgi:hypothetical protein
MIVAIAGDYFMSATQVVWAVIFIFDFEEGAVARKWFGNGSPGKSHS